MAEKFTLKQLYDVASGAGRKPASYTIKSSDLMFCTINTGTGSEDSIALTMSELVSYIVNTGTNIRALTADWESTAGQVLSLSSQWNSAYTDVFSNSANWDNTYTVTYGNSARWESVYTNINSNSGTGTVNFLTKWTTTKKIGDSTVREQNGKVGIGLGDVEPDSAKLTIKGPDTTTIALSVFGSIVATGDVLACSTSDERLKKNIRPITNGLEFVTNCDGYKFEWDRNIVKDRPVNDVGVLAQEVEKYVPEAVVTRDNGYKAVNYEKLIPVLLNAIKQLSNKVTILEKEIKNKDE